MTVDLQKAFALLRMPTRNVQQQFSIEMSLFPTNLFHPRASVINKKY